MQRANLRVHDLSQRSVELRSMATTLTAVALAGSQAYIAHVGDSRAYLWRDGTLTQLTSDHSEVAELVRMRIVKPERVRDHPGRNILTRTIGSQLILRPDFQRQTVRSGDKLLLCSDGLWSDVVETEMAEILASCNPAEACRALIDRAIERECLDNVSVQVVKVVAVEMDPSQNAARNGWFSGIFRRSSAT